MKLTYQPQLQQQQQETPPAQGSAPPDATLNADIAAFLAEGHEPDEGPAEPAPAATEEDPDADEPSDESEPAEPEVADEGEPEEAEKPAAPAGVDVASLTKAVEAGDPAAFIKALGPAAEKLLTSKAHVALRLQAKEAEQAKGKAEAEQTRAKELAVKLGEKYGDPIAARRAAENGDVDAFIDMAEKWAGHPWNDVMRWVTSGLAGRKERLEKKERATSAELAGKQAQQEQKAAEVTAWVDQGVKKLAPELHDPEVVQMVVAEIRAGYAKGINTPAKALPAVRKKLQARYEQLHKVFGKSAPSGKQRAREASAVAPSLDRAPKTRPTSLEEDIAWAKRQAGVK